ncbi:MAG TPA: hypothetical protein VMT03_19200 [Polyangia bacterium]|nr:hypothetical protein [Polyangia bacterium]
MSTMRTKRLEGRVFFVAAVLAIGGTLGGCFTTMGYGIGSAVDEHRAQLEFHGNDARRGLRPDEHVRLLCRDGSQRDGTVVAIRASGVLLLQEAPSGPASEVPLGDISGVWEKRRPTSGRTIGVVAGLVIDVAVFILIARSQLSGSINIGSFN